VVTLIGLISRSLKLVEADLTETEVRIVDRYFQECKNLFTTTNRKVGKNKEIDLLAYDPKNNVAYHVEVSVTFRPLGLEESIHKSDSNRSRDSLNYFLSDKFSHQDIEKGISKILGPNVKPKRILVVGKMKKQEEDEIREMAQRNNLEIMLIGECICELEKKAKSGSRDDAVRTIELIKRYQSST